MDEKTQLNERSQAVLTAVINHYIATAEPVGSRTIAKLHSEKLSSATIRNVMSDLEDLGFLHQPHTSAGRIPTDKGYRYLVDQLMVPPGQLQEAEFIHQNYELKDNNLEELLEQACNLLSETSNQAGLVMIPSFHNMLFKHIEFVKVGKTEALAVFISEMGILQNKIIKVDEKILPDELTSISNFLNQEFSGRSIKTIRREILRRIRNEKKRYHRLMNNALDLWFKTFQEEDDGELLVDGMLNLFDQPEFAADIKKMKALLKALEEKSKLVKILDQCLNQDGMTIIIGEENSEEEMQGCSLIAQNYGLGSKNKGTMAVFGPKRMDYQKMIPLVDHTAHAVSLLLSEKK